MNSSYLQLTQLSEASREGNDGVGFIHVLLQDHESIIKTLRADITRFANELHDLGSIDFITGLMETHESRAWKLRAHLKQ